MATFPPAPGTIGIGVGRLSTPIIERGEDPAGHFESVVWFPADKLAEATEFAAGNPKWVVREGIRL